MSDQARELRYRLIEPRAVAEALGLTEGAKRQTNGLMVCCPWHVERTPSCSITVGPDGTLRAHCFGCGHSGDVLSLIAEVRGLDVRRDFRRVLEEAASMAGIQLAELRPSANARPKRAAPSSMPPLGRPPKDEVAAVWACCNPVYDDLDLRQALEARAIDPVHVTDRDLARALPPSIRLPAWARCGRSSWTELGNRLVLPMYDDGGAIVTLHARRLRDGNAPKGLSPTGYRVAGATFADPLARLLLTGETVAWWKAKAIILAEGAPDFLTIATHYGDAEEQGPAILGVLSGSFTAAIGGRIPNDSTVVIRTHHDRAGDHYADEIIRILGTRCSLRRSAAYLRAA